MADEGCREIALLDFVNIWNVRQNLATPDLHHDMIQWLGRNWAGQRQELLLMAFRNSGKSTLVGLFCAWLLYRQNDLRIMVLAADLALARKMVRNVKRIIERHALTENLKPGRADQWAADQFTINRSAELRDPSMLARGVEANVTGSRADVVICDDVEVPNTCSIEYVGKELRQRLDEIDYVLTPGGMQLYVGTPHTFDTIYGDGGECYLAGFERLALPLLDKPGNSRWPQRFPPARIAAMRRRSGPNKFASQMMLQPVDINDGRLDPDRLRLYDAELQYREGNGEAVLMLAGRRLVSASCWWDPSYGAPGKGDGSVIAVVYTDDHGDYWLHRVAYLTHDPALIDAQAEAIQMCAKAARFVGDHYLGSVTIETNGVGGLLPGLLRREIEAAGLAAAVVGKASTQAKDQRIVDAFDAVLAAGMLHAHRSVWDSPFIAEMREWRPATNCRDDGLDAVSGCLLAEPVRLPRRPPADGQTPRRASWRPGSRGFKVHSDFAP